MCYKAGPRCPSVALLAIEKAEHKWETASNVSERNTAMNEIMEARHQYDLTIKGQKQLESMIEVAKVNGEREEADRLRNRLENARRERQELLASQGIKDTRKDAKHTYAIPTSQEKPNERTARLLEMAKVETKALSTSEGWKNHLETTANFPTMSFNNQVLVQAQDPEATSLNTYEDWAKNGRAVTRNTQGVYLLSPTVTSVREKDPQTGKIVYAERITGFRSVATFDVKSTTGKDVESSTPPIAEYRDHLTEKMKGYGYNIEPVDPQRLGGKKSFASLKEKKIYVAPNLTPDEQVEVLSHNLSRISLGHDKNPPRSREEVENREIEARSLTHVLMRRGGLQDDISFDRIDGWAQRNPASRYAERISKAAKFLLQK